MTKTEIIQKAINEANIKVKKIVESQIDEIVIAYIQSDLDKLVEKYKTKFDIKINLKLNFNKSSFIKVTSKDK